MRHMHKDKAVIYPTSKQQRGQSYKANTPKN